MGHWAGPMRKIYGKRSQGFRLLGDLLKVLNFIFIYLFKVLSLNLIYVKLSNFN
jgi:hypothetical protein